MEHNSYEPDWDVYFSTIENKPAYIGVDLNLNSIAPLIDKTQMIEVSIHLLSNQVDGFPADEEWEALGQIEDGLAEKLEAELQAIFSGKTLSDGRRRFYFYAAYSDQYERYVSQVMSFFPKYRYEYKNYEDPSWDTYFDLLFPQPIDLQRISNSRVVRHLQEQGDQQEVPRQIDHWIYFQNQADRETYWQAIKNKGFQVEDLEFEKESPGMPYKLQISRIDQADEETINDVCIELWQLAKKYNGEYDGWETYFIKADQ